MDREAVPKIVQARDFSSTCCAMDPGDAPQGVERRLNGAAGEPRFVPVRQQQSVLALSEPAAPTPGHVVGQYRCQLWSDRNQLASAVVVENRG